MLREAKDMRSTELDLSGLDDLEKISLCEALDRVLNKGAVITGQVMISVAGVDLVYLGLQVALMSAETAHASGAGRTAWEARQCN